MSEEMKRAWKAGERGAEALRLGHRALKDIDDGIIAYSPTIPADGTTLAHRIVLRDLGKEYVVHTQIWEDNKAYFHQGYYFAKSTAPSSVAQPDNVALAKAWAQFESRSRRTLGLEEVGVL